MKSPLEKKGREVDPREEFHQRAQLLLKQGEFSKLQALGQELIQLAPNTAEQVNYKMGLFEYLNADLKEVLTKMSHEFLQQGGSYMQVKLPNISILESTDLAEGMIRIYVHFEYQRISWFKHDFVKVLSLKPSRSKAFISKAYDFPLVEQPLKVELRPFDPMTKLIYTLPWSQASYERFKDWCRKEEIKMFDVACVLEQISKQKGDIQTPTWVNQHPLYNYTTRGGYEFLPFKTVNSFITSENGIVAFGRYSILGKEEISHLHPATHQAIFFVFEQYERYLKLSYLSTSAPRLRKGLLYYALEFPHQRLNRIDVSCYSILDQTWLTFQGIPFNLETFNQLLECLEKEASWGMIESWLTPFAKNGIVTTKTKPVGSLKGKDIRYC